jgi:hypothetical protein
MYCTYVENDSIIGSLAMETTLRASPRSTRLAAIELHTYSSIAAKTRSITHPRAHGSEIAGSNALKQTGYQQASERPRYRGKVDL